MTKHKCDNIENYNKYISSISNISDTLQEMAEIFNAMSDPVRLSILWLLSHSELCVHEIETLIKQKQSTVSHHLRILRNLRLVKYRKEGKHVFYSLEDDHIKEIMYINKTHVEETE